MVVLGIVGLTKVVVIDTLVNLQRKVMAVGHAIDDKNCNEGDLADVVIVYGIDVVY